MGYSTGKVVATVWMYHSALLFKLDGPLVSEAAVMLYLS
jgi:hypothetical protein